MSRTPLRTMCRSMRRTALGSVAAGHVRLARTPERGMLRPPVILRKTIAAIQARAMFMLALIARELDVTIMLGDPFFRPRLAHDSARAVERESRSTGDHNGSVNIYMREADSHRQDRRVVFEYPTGPSSADEADPVVSEPVVHAAIKSDMRTPVARVPDVSSTLKPPISGRPEQSGRRRLNPHAGNPVIPRGRIVRPISRRPQIADGGARRQFVNRQNRRRDCDNHGSE